MNLRRLTLSALTLVLLLPAGAALAQTTAIPQSDGLYALTPRAAFEAGCFDPCMCIAHYSDTPVGTWRMTPAAPDPLYAVYDIKEVNWLLPALGQRVTGSGTYRIGGEFARMHQLSLDLVVGDNPVQHFDSGLVLGGAEFPEIVLTITVNNMVCHDTVFQVAAAPILPRLVPYSLHGSTYEEGCFGPCDCAVVAKPLGGRFGLMRLRDDTAGTDYAVLDLRWAVRSSPLAASTDATPITGYGIYRTRKAGPEQRLMLDLIENGAGPTRFDSGTVPGGAQGPGGGPPRRIDIDVAAHGFACYDRVYSVHARRRNAATLDFGALGPEPVPIGVVPAP